MNLIVIHHNLIRWTADELVGGPKQWFCIDNEKEVRELLASPQDLSGLNSKGILIFLTIVVNGMSILIRTPPSRLKKEGHIIEFFY